MPKEIKSVLALLTPLALSFLLSGCSSTLVDDPHQEAAAVSHCDGAEMVDDSSVAVLPVPIVAFFVPHADTNEISAEEYLGRCGTNKELINRKVEVDRTACIPAGLTRIVTLGVWQWCPSRVTWEADRIAANE